MSIITLPPLHALNYIHGALPLTNADHSVVVYTTVDRVTYDAYPSPIYGSQSLIDLTTILSAISAKFVIQVSNLYIRHAINAV